jgi:large subunit ribosomal protein L21
MYAIVDIAGQQFKVEKDQKLYVHRLEGEEGKKVSFDKVLLIDTGSKISVGDPVVNGASVAAKIVSHLKGDKVLVFKKKRRKGYQKLNGHRQHFTQIQIEGISEKGAAKNEEAAKPVAVKEEATAKKPAAKTTAAKQPQPKDLSPKAKNDLSPEAKKPAATKKPAAAKTTAAKKPATKKPAAKKPAANQPKDLSPKAKKQTGEDKA